MSSIRVRHAGVTRLAADMKHIVTVEAPRDMVATVRESVSYGTKLARANAKRTAGKHGKWYPSSITADQRTGRGAGFGVLLYSGEYGPDPARRQGGMSFENGSRNQPPHHDMAKSADVVGPMFASKVAKQPDGWFW